MSHTDDLIAMIDGALDDWWVSGDAMRWRPDPPPPAGEPQVRPVSDGPEPVIEGGWPPYGWVSPDWAGIEFRDVTPEEQWGASVRYVLARYSVYPQVIIGFDGSGVIP